MIRSIECVDCNGEGEVEIMDPPWPTDVSPPSHLEDCETCEGKGSIEVEDE